MEKPNISEHHSRHSFQPTQQNRTFLITAHSIFARLAISLALIYSLPIEKSHAHGGVFLEEDICVIQIGFFKAHFTIFQPQISQHVEICEDIPTQGETLFVMEFLHDGLREMLVDFRIIKDTEKLGRFAKLEDIKKIKDLYQRTVFYQPASINPDGVYLAQHELVDKGYYIGIVSAENPNDGSSYSAVFPFQVGASTWGYIPAIIILALFLQLNYWLMAGGYQRIRRRMKK